MTRKLIVLCTLNRQAKNINFNVLESIFIEIIGKMENIILLDAYTNTLKCQYNSSTIP